MPLLGFAAASAPAATPTTRPVEDAEAVQHFGKEMAPGVIGAHAVARGD
jgi:hypothetical protein